MSNFTRLLTKPEFMGTFRDPMRDITGQEDDLEPDGVIDLRPYISSIPLNDLLGHTLLGDDIVEHVSRTGDNQFDHVAFPCVEKNVFLVVIVSLTPGEPYGHFLLDLNHEYGLPPARL